MPSGFLKNSFKRLVAVPEAILLLLLLAGWYARNLQGGLGVDEVVYVRTGYQIFHGQLYQNPTHIFTPTAKYFIGFGQLLLGESALGARLPILVFALLTLAVTYLISIRLGNRGIGFIAIGLLGTTYIFARHSVIAMLDIPLTFFYVTLIYVTLRWFDTRTPLFGVLIGVCGALVITTKAYGFLYAIPVIMVVTAASVSGTDWKAAVSELRHAILGGSLTLFAVYSPYFFVQHPPVRSEYAPVLEWLLSLPILGNVLYVFGVSYRTNFAHIGGGHSIVVNSVVYQYPPVWSYLYWLYDMGVIFLLFLLGVIGVGIVAVQRGASEIEGYLIPIAVLAPLAIMSGMTVKFPRYILPVLPLLVVGGVYALFLIVEKTVHRYGGLPESVLKEQLIYVVLIVLVVGLSLIPPSSMGATVSQPIRTDSGHDAAAEWVNGCAERTSESGLVVFAYHHTALEYYLRGGSGVQVFSFTPYDVSNAQKYNGIHQRLREGEIDIIVTQQQNTRLQKSHPSLYQFIRNVGEHRLSVPQSPSGNLVIYSFENTDC